jgi:hypothetical protein
MLALGFLRDHRQFRDQAGKSGLAAQRRLAGSVTSHLQKPFCKVRLRTLTLATFATAFDAILAEIRWLAMVGKSRDRGKSAGPRAG